MDHYKLTVIFAHRTPKKDHQAFPAHTLSPESLQIIHVQEEDVYSPHSASLGQIARAEGAYTILLDEGDKFDSRFLERLLQASDASDAAFVMPSYRNHFVKRTNEYFSLPGGDDLCIDIREKQTLFPMELHGLMLPTKPLQAAMEHATDSVEPEKQVILTLLAGNPTLRYLGSCPIDYAVPKECDTPFDVRCMTREWYYRPFERFLIPRLENEASNTPLIQCMALYMLHLRLRANINNHNTHVIAPEDVPEYLEFCSSVLQYVSDGVILNQASQLTVSTPQACLLDMRLKRRDFSYYPKLVCKKHGVSLTCEGYELRNQDTIAIHLSMFDYKDGCLLLDGEYNDYYAPGSCEICASFDGKKYALSYNQRYSLTKYFGVSAFRMKTFHVSIPVSNSDKDRTLQFLLCVQGRDYAMQYAFPLSTSRFAKDFGYMYWKFDRYLAYWKGTAIHVVPSGRLLVLKKEIGLWLQMWKKKNGAYRDLLPLKIVNFLLRPYFARQKIWLFLDKIYKGGDSSEYIYRYADRQKDGIKKYYLLDKTSADYARMRKVGYRPLVRGSLKHHLVFLNASMVIASNSTVFPFNDFGFVRSLPIRGDVHFDVACVQHGMSVQKIAVAQQRLRDNTALYFCASRYEIENLSKPVYDYLGYDALKLTGVPRYDGLKNRAQKIILISPTWRMNSALPAAVSEGFSRDYNPNFRDTAYYKVYNGLINDPRLLAAVQTYGYRIQYVLHPIVSPQHEDFTKNDFVEIIPSIGDMSYEKLFCEAALMVTDFSGVQFDFAYMRKPVLYLHHHDIPQHYEEGTFHYKTMGFGEICHTNEELIDVLGTYMKNNCEMPPLYRKRADDFFAFSDNKNCERIYPIMLAHERNRTRLR